MRASAAVRPVAHQPVRGRRAAAGAGLALAVAGLHLAAFTLLAPAADEGLSARGRSRALAPERLGRDGAPTSALRPPVALQLTARPQPQDRAAPPRVEPAAAAPPATARAMPRPLRGEPVVQASAAPGGAAPAAAALSTNPVPPVLAARDAVPTAAAVGGEPLPVYATRLPDAVLLHYELRRGAVVGRGRLAWTRDGETYELSLDAEMPGQALLGAASRGVVDVHGVAPQRFVDRRRSRDVRAVNFQREAQRITFSGPQADYALVPGAQDRLSWMLQLAGIVQADAAHATPGARVTMFVAGTRGEAEAWHFEAQGHGALDLPAGHVPAALHLKREPTRPYDTRIEVWLDPARGHLPVRVLSTVVPGGQPTEWLLALSGPAP